MASRFLLFATFLFIQLSGCFGDDSDEFDGWNGPQKTGTYPRIQPVHSNLPSKVLPQGLDDRSYFNPRGGTSLSGSREELPQSNHQNNQDANQHRTNVDQSQESDKSDSESTETRSQGNYRGTVRAPPWANKFPNQSTFVKNTGIISGQPKLTSEQSYLPIASGNLPNPTADRVINPPVLGTDKYVADPYSRTREAYPTNNGWVETPGTAPSDNQWNVGSDKTYAVREPTHIYSKVLSPGSIVGGEKAGSGQQVDDSDSSDSSEEDARRAENGYGKKSAGKVDNGLRPMKGDSSTLNLPDDKGDVGKSGYPNTRIHPDSSDESRPGGSEESSSSEDDRGEARKALYDDEGGERSYEVGDTERPDSRDSEMGNLGNPTRRTGPYDQDIADSKSDDKDTLNDEILSEEERADGPRDADKSDEDYSPDHSTLSSEERHGEGAKSSDEDGNSSDNDNKGGNGDSSNEDSAGDSTNSVTCSINDIGTCLGRLARYNPQTLSIQLYSTAEELCSDIERMSRCFDERRDVCSSDVLYREEVLRRSTQYICQEREDFEEVYKCLTEASDIYSKCYISQVVSDADSTLIQRKCRPVENFEECVSTITASECGDKAGETVRNYYGDSRLNPRLTVETEMACPFIEALEEPALTEETKTALALGLTLAGCAVIGGAVVASAVIGARKRTQMQQYILDEA